MKIRTGFVSNSSSSSFIAISPKTSGCEKCQKLIESLFKENINAREYVVKEYCYETYEDFLEDYIDYKSLLINAVKENKDILVTDVEYGAEEQLETVLGILEVEYEIH